MVSTSTELLDDVTAIGAFQATRRPHDAIAQLFSLPLFNNVIHLEIRDSDGSLEYLVTRISAPLSFDAYSPSRIG